MTSRLWLVPVCLTCLPGGCSGERSPTGPAGQLPCDTTKTIGQFDAPCSPPTSAVGLAAAAPGLTASVRVTSAADSGAGTLRAVGTGDAPGGAVSTGNACTLRISRCAFRGNMADCGGAVHAGYGTCATIEDCLFRDNDGAGANNGFSAGAISTYGHGELVVRRCDFVANRGNSGAAVYNLLQPITIEDCTFAGNVSNQDGAAIFTDEGNWVGPGATKGGHILVRRCWMEGNRSHAFGGACMLWANALDTVMVENCVFKDNSVARGGQWGDSKGGAIRGSGRLTIRNCAFVRNQAVAQGGALWLDGNGALRDRQLHVLRQHGCRRPGRRHDAEHRRTAHHPQLHYRGQYRGPRVWRALVRQPGAAHHDH